MADKNREEGQSARYPVASRLAISAGVRAAPFVGHNIRKQARKGARYFADLATEAPKRQAEAIEATKQRLSSLTKIYNRRNHRAHMAGTKAKEIADATRYLKDLRMAGPESFVTRKATGTQKALANVASKVQAIKGTAKSAGSKATEFLRTRTPFATPAEMGSKIGASLDRNIVGRAVKRTGKAVGGLAKGAAKLTGGLATLPGKVLGSVAAVTTNGSKAGRLLKFAASPQLAAGAFAASSWLEAGMNFYDNRKELSDYASHLFKPLYTEKVVGKDGKVHTVEHETPSILRSTVGSSKYWGEVVRGLVRNASFGFFGNEEWDWERGDIDEAETNRRLQAGLDPMTGKPIRATDGTDVSSAIASKNIAANNAVERNASIAAALAWFDHFNRKELQGEKDQKRVKAGLEFLGIDGRAATDISAYKQAVKALGQAKDAKLDALRQQAEAGSNPALENELARRMRLGGIDRETAVKQYLDQAATTENNKYNQRVEAMSWSSAGHATHKLVQTGVYAILSGGRNFDEDFDAWDAGKLDETTLASLEDYMAAIGFMSHSDIALFDVVGFQERFDKAVEEEYKALLAQEAQPQEAQPQEAQPQEAQPQEAQPQEAQPQEAQPQEPPRT